jgi:copper oxidase (laccase) domain-containing protein
VANAGSVAACSSTRIGGVSLPPYDSLNLGAHCGDNLQHVEENRGGCLPPAACRLTRFGWSRFMAPMC